MNELARECEVFARFLSGEEPSAYVMSRYLEAHRMLGRLDPETRFDRFMCQFARSSPLSVRLADAWAALFAPTCVLRCKLVLLLAMLESCAPHHRRLEDVRGGAVVGSAALALYGLVASLSLLASLLIFVPARVLLGSSGGTK